jgi:hypothetical protein
MTSNVEFKKCTTTNFQFPSFISYTTQQHMMTVSYQNQKMSECENGDEKIF